MKLPRACGAALSAAACHAAADSARAPASDRVHAARVAAKRLRSYWCALIPAIGAAEARRRRRELSRAAKALAGAREREVLAALARDLARSQPSLAEPLTAFADRLKPVPPSSIRRSLISADRKLSASARNLSRAARTVSRGDLEDGVSRLKRKLKHARRDAARNGEIAVFHLCRKRAKDLQYLLEAFDLKPRAAREFRRAADALGDARDLRRLSARARLHGPALEKRARDLEAEALKRL